MAEKGKTFNISQFMFAGSDGSFFSTLSFYVILAYLFLIAPTIVYFFRLPSKILATSIFVAVLLFTSTLPLEISLSHSLFVLVTALKLFGPLILGLAVWAHVWKLQHLEKTLSALNIKIRWATFNAATLVFCVIQAEVLICYALGIFHFAALHSSAPIEGIAQALARLDHESWSVNLIGAGSVLQIIACFHLALCTAFGLCRSLSNPHLNTGYGKVQKLEQRVLLAACVALPLICIEPLYKVSLIYIGGAFSSESLTAFTSTETGSLLAFTIDIFPPLVAFAALAMQNVWTFELQSLVQHVPATLEDNVLHIAIPKGQATVTTTEIKHEYNV